jgi:heptosyltransferase-2
MKPEATQRTPDYPPSWLRKWAGPVLLTPFANAIPLDYAPVRGKPAISLLWRRLRPALSLRWHGQSALQLAQFPAGVRRVLWIYKGVPQIGDSLMDLSSRAMLQERGIAVDLCTDPHLAELYRADQVFGRVFSHPEEANPASYDLALLDSLKWRCLEAKLGKLGRLPFVSMRGCFAGPEFNRTLFSFFRMNQLLGASLSNEQIHASARPLLFAAAADAATADHLQIAPNSIAFALGGADPHRTYRHWHEVIARLLQQAPDLQLVLLGSRNALEMRDRVLTATQSLGHDRIIDCVNRLTLLQSFEVLKRCRLALAADGGLLHVAHAAVTPTVALFDQHISPALRLTAANRSLPLQSSGDTSAIPVQEVTQCITQALQKFQAAN